MKERFRFGLLWCVRALGGFALARLLTRRAVMIVGWHGVSLEREHERFSSLFDVGGVEGYDLEPRGDHKLVEVTAASSALAGLHNH